MATSSTEYLNKLIFRIISNTASELGVRVFVVGEYVRDCFLGRENNCIDIVVEGDNIELGQKLGIITHSRVTYFKNFGVSLFDYKGDKIKILRARKELIRREDQKQIFIPGTIDEDIKLRDFTINAIALSLNRGEMGRIIDFTGGLNDISQGVIRTTFYPGKYFYFDALGMLRAVRLVSQLSTSKLEFHIDSECMDSIRRNIDKIDSIAKERIAEELNKMLLCDVPGKSIFLLNQLGLLNKIIPLLSATKGVDTIDGVTHEDSFRHSISVLDNIARISAKNPLCTTNSLGIEKGEPNLWLRWAALLHEIGKPQAKKFVRGAGWTFHGYDVISSKMVPKVFTALKLPQDEKMKYVQKLIYLQNRSKALLEEGISESAYRRLLLDAGDDIDDLILLNEANITTGNKYKADKALADLELIRKKLAEVKAKDSVNSFKNPINANHIMELYGIEPGRTIGLLKDYIKKAILDGEIGNNFEEADALLRKKATEMGLKTKEEVQGDNGSSRIFKTKDEFISEQTPIRKAGITEGTIRINKILKDFNIGLSTLNDFLKKRGFTDTLTLTSKVSEDVFAMIAKEFGKDHFLREQSRKVDVKELGTSVLEISPVIIKAPNNLEFRNTNTLGQRTDDSSVVRSLDEYRGSLLFSIIDTLLKKKVAETSLQAKERASDSKSSGGSNQEQSITNTKANVESRMLEGKIRVTRILKDFNIGLSTLTEFLKKRGFSDNLTLTSKVSEDTYAMVYLEYGRKKLDNELPHKETTEEVITEKDTITDRDSVSAQIDKVPKTVHEELDQHILSAQKSINDSNTPDLVTDVSEVISAFNACGVSKLYFLTKAEDLETIKEKGAIEKESITLYTNDISKNIRRESFIALEIDLRVLAFPGAIVSFEVLASKGIHFGTEVSRLLVLKKGMEIYSEPLLNVTSSKPLSNCVIIVKKNLPLEYIINFELMYEAYSSPLPF